MRKSPFAFRNPPCKHQTPPYFGQNASVEWRLPGRSRIHGFTLRSITSSRQVPIKIIERRPMITEIVRYWSIARKIYRYWSVLQEILYYWSLIKNVFSFLLGVVFGAILALLFAPQSGKELRAKIQSTAEKDWQIMQEQWQAETEKIHQRLDQMQSEQKQAQQ